VSAGATAAAPGRTPAPPCATRTSSWYIKAAGDGGGSSSHTGDGLVSTIGPRARGPGTPRSAWENVVRYEAAASCSIGAAVHSLSSVAEFGSSESS
jgi:hypothetical protein